jgi:hypothetical protein
MKSIAETMLFCGIALAISCTKSVASENLFEQGKEAYQKKDLTTAQKCFVAEIGVRPQNVFAHYYLANTLLISGQKDAAIREYQECVRLEPTGAAAQYSRVALKGIETNVSSKDARTTVQTRSQSVSEETQSPVKESAHRISCQTDALEQQAKDEWEARNRTIREDAQRKIAQLNQKKAEDVAANGQPVYARYGRYGQRAVALYDPASLNQSVSENYDAQIARINEQADKQINELSIYYKKKLAAFEDSATVLEKSYLPSSRESNVNLVPQGTTVYARNYQTHDEASGQPVPLAASPARPLLQGR